MLVDLHLHSTLSDGRYTPKELVQAAVANNIGVIALTDHDSLNGYEEAVAEAERINKLSQKQLIRVIAGAELSTQYKKRAVHVLGYHLSADCEPLILKMAEMRHKREYRLAEILKKCRLMGMDITIEACDSKARAVGRPHVAKAMVAKGYVHSVQEAFDKYLHRGAPCYVEQPKLTPEEAVDLIHRAGGIAVLAHPSEIEASEIPEYLLSTIPFDGIEIWHPSVMETQDLKKWLKLAKKYHLLVSGGSDFHGIPDRYPAQLGIWQVKYEDTAGVIEFINKQK